MDLQSGFALVRGTSKNLNPAFLLDSFCGGQQSRWDKTRRSHVWTVLVDFSVRFGDKVKVTVEVVVWMGVSARPQSNLVRVS